MAPNDPHEIFASFDPDTKSYEELYKYIHANGELSKCERETAKLVADKLKGFSSDLDIRTGIGGHGLIAILKNGPGKTVLLRADMDALPVKEDTGLPYESKKRMPDINGVEKPVMHGESMEIALILMYWASGLNLYLACGHDFHITCGLAAAEYLINTRKTWSGTCVFLFQPSEETVSGARTMVDDGLYDPKRHGCPIPDLLLAQHVVPLPAGVVSVGAGTAMATSDSFKVVVYGSGGHGAAPNRTIDPIVIASHVVVRLQTIVSREVAPSQFGVVTVGLIQAGETPNIIPDQAELRVNVRCLNPTVREKTIAAMKRIIKAECDAGASPKEPLIEHIQRAPLLENDQKLHDVLEDAFTKHFEKNFVPNMPPFPGSEDFPELGIAVGKPYCFWFFGGHIMDESEKGLPIDEMASHHPSNHSPFFAPALEPTLRTGIEAMVVAALAAFKSDI